jgi:xylulokinase
MADEGKDLVLGYDCGTSSIKAALFDRTGHVAASARATFPLLLPAPGWAEQRPSDWWEAMRRATADLLDEAHISPARIAAIGISGQMCGVVPVDRDGVPLHNALIWLDTRSEAIARRLLAGWITIGGYGPMALLYWLYLTRGAPNLSGKDPTSKFLWLREERPALWPRVHKLLDVKDYLVHRCTGAFTTTPDCAHLTWLLDARPRRKDWSAQLLRRVGLDRSLLPAIKGAGEVAGALRPEAAAALGLAAETPVSAGLGDVSAFALASGRRSPGALHLYIGTSAWLGAHLPRARVDPRTGIGSVCSADAKDYLAIAAQEAAGSCVEWAAAALGLMRDGAADFGAFEQEAAASSPGPDAPFFFPWLHGERVPIDDSQVRAGFVGLSAGHGRADLARAVLEGVALNLRWALQSFERLSRRPAAPIRFLGAGAQNRLWTRILADVLGEPIERMADPHLGGALGAAMTAAVIAGWYPGLDEAMSMVRLDERVDPDPAMAPLYAERFARYVAHYRRTKTWYRDRASG